MNSTADTRTAYLYARILLGVSVALSLACNSAHAYLNAERVQVLLAMGVGAIPPLILALSVEAVVFCSRHARWAWGWAAVTLAAGVGLVTGFSMSFAAIRDLGLMANMSAYTAPMLPVGIDALVITGLGMVALFRPRHDTAATLPAAATNTTTTEISPAPAAATATQLPPVSDAEEVTEELPVVAATTPVADPAATTPTTPVTSDDTVVGADNRQGTTTEPAEAEEPVDTPADADHQAPVTPVAAPELRLVADAAADDDHAAVAAELVAAGRLKPENQAAATRALELLAADPPPSQRAIAAAAGLDRSIVKKLIDAAAEASA
jgi:hypothetical protein